MSGVLTILLWIVGLAVLLRVSVHKPRLMVALLVGFIIRSGLSWINCEVAPLPGTGMDSEFFENLAFRYSQHGFVSAFMEFRMGSRMYPWLVSLLYCLVGRNILLVHLINAFLGTLIAWNVYRSALLLWNEKVANRAAWITVLFPSMCLFSSIMLREAVIGYMVSLGAVYLIRWWQGGRFADLVRCSLAYLGAYCFHAALIAAVAALGALIFWHSFRTIFQRKGLAVFKAMISVGGIVAVLGVIWILGIGMDKFGSRDEQIQEKLRTQQAAASRSRAAYMEGVEVNTPASLSWQLPARMVCFLFMPFPWMVRTVSDVIGVVDATMFLGLCVGIYRSRRFILQRPGAVPVLCILFGLLVIFSLGTSNYGTAIRHKTKLAPLFICVMALNPVPKLVFRVARARS